MSLFLLEEKPNVKFGGVVRCELYLQFECVFRVFIYNSNSRFTHYQYYTNPLFCNVLQIMNENQTKEEPK